MEAVVCHLCFLFCLDFFNQRMYCYNILLKIFLTPRVFDAEKKCPVFLIF